MKSKKLLQDDSPELLKIFAEKESGPALGHRAGGDARVYHAKRLDVLRSFARYLAVFERRTEIPPQRLLGPSFMRAPPHIYTPQEIAALIRESLTYQPSLRRDPLTGLRNATIIGLLACTGLRIGEVLALKDSDVDLDQSLITVRHSKNLPMRLVPITDCAAGQLRRYREARDQRFGRSGDSEAFIRSPRGGYVSYRTVSWAFKRLRTRAGLKNSSGRNPRSHLITGLLWFGKVAGNESHDDYREHSPDTYNGYVGDDESHYDADDYG